MTVTAEQIALLQENLRTLRFIFGLSYEDLSKYLGLSKKTIQRIELGKSRISKPYYYAIEKCFNDKRLNIEGNAVTGKWYNDMYHLFTEPGLKPWKAERKRITDVVWIFQVKCHRKGVDYELVRKELYNLLKDVYTRPLYYSK